MTTLIHERLDSHAGSTRGMPPVRSPEEFCLPAGYRQQTEAFTHDEARASDGAPREEYWNPQRIATSARWQFHVYAWAASLVRARGLRSVLDVGCGPGTKLASLIAPVCGDLEGIDQRSAIAVAKRLGSPGAYSPIDLERCDDVRAWRRFDLIVCADVIEHLLDPDPLLRLLARFCHTESLVLLSTPDRARLHGRACMVSDKPEHVREWAAPEFLRYLRVREYSIERVRTLPADDSPFRAGLVREWLWRTRLARTSPRRCLAVLCRPRHVGGHAPHDQERRA